MSVAMRAIATMTAMMSATLPLGVAANSPPAWQSDFKLKLGGFAEGARDLGLPPADPAAEAIDATSAGYLDGQGSLLWQRDDRWAAYLRIQGFATSDEFVVTDEEQPRRTESFLAAREFWLQYGGLMAYPGEVLRLGRQRVRAADGLWWDQDIESLRWIIDTTLLQAQIGIAEAFSSYRTQDSDPAPVLRDRAYAYASAHWEWTERNRVGLRATHAFDHIDLDEEFAGPAGERDRKQRDVQLTWIGAQLSNDFFSDAQRWPLAYWAEASYLFGKQKALSDPLLPPDPLAARHDIAAWAFDGGLRWRISRALPVQLGAAYAYGSGGGSARTSERYEQTGLHSNRSRFTGTRSLLYRYGEALQPDLSNLQVASVFVSLPMERFDASAVVHRYWRTVDDQGITVDGVDVQPEPGLGRTLGHGYDLVLSHYFGSLAPRAVNDGEDLRSNIRLRGSLFDPASGYSRAPADTQYRVTLELTLWF